MMARSIALWLGAAWLMALSTLGFLVVPLLFVYLPTPAVAGTMAAHLFSAQTGVSVACGLGLLLALRAPAHGFAADLSARMLLLTLAGLLLALLVEFAVAPRIVARVDLVLWHRVGTGMYLGQWLCALALFAMLVRDAAHAPPASPSPSDGP
jgi:hypothetical protein